MAFHNTALFVIDIQKELASDPKTEIPHASRIRAAGQQILSAVRGLNSPEVRKAPILIVFVQHEEKPEDGTLIRGSEAWKLVFEPREDVADEMLVAKHTRDTFESNPLLAEELKAKGVKHVVTFGIQSECCVKSTSEGALSAGFRVTLLQGAHSTYDSGSKTASEIESEVEEGLRAKGVQLLNWKEWAELWEDNSGTPAHV